MDTYVECFDKNVRPLMDKIDQVRQILSSNNYGIDFPSVIVVGDQSSGKSSLLESLSLVELPKGNGIVTRCPLVLRLRNSNKRSVYRLYDDNRKVTLDETRLNMPQYIEQETRKLAGYQKNVVEDFIELEVEDPHVRDLTVVDLPGIARVAVADQPTDIHKQTTNLIRRFIRKEGSIILCVFPATVDVGVVEAFSLAREFDSSGERTIGVITKSDLAPDSDMLIHQVLMDRRDVLKLKLGFVAVRNRSTDETMSLEDARERETEFFNQHSVKSVVTRNCFGIDALSIRLSNLYSDRVKEVFPKLRDDIKHRLQQVNQQLSKLPPILQTSEERLTAYNELVDLFIGQVLKPQLKASISNQGTNMENMLHYKLIAYQSIVQEQRQEIFSRENRRKVEHELLKIAGQDPPNFLSSFILKKFIHEKLDQLWEITEKVIDESFLTTRNLLLRAGKKECDENVLLSKMINVFRRSTESYMDESRIAAHDELRALIALDRNNPYVINSFYTNIVEKYTEPSTEESQTANADNPCLSKVLGDDDTAATAFILNAISTHDQSLKLMLISIYAYWHMLTKRFIDYVALVLRAKCLFNVCPTIHQRLRHIDMERCRLIETCLGDDDDIRQIREQLQTTKTKLDNAHDIVCGANIIVENRENELAAFISPEYGSSHTTDPHTKRLRDADDNCNIIHGSTLSTTDIPLETSLSLQPPEPTSEQQTTNQSTPLKLTANQPPDQKLNFSGSNIPVRKK